MLFGIAGSYLLQGVRGNPNRPDAQETVQKDTSPVIAQIGDFEITSKTVQTAAEDSLKQIRTDPAPTEVYGAYGQALERQLQNAMGYRLLKDHGVQVTDADIRKFVEQQLDQSLFQARLQLQFSKKISEKATDAEVKAELKKEGQDFDASKAQTMARLEQLLKDPNTHRSLEADAGQQLLISKLQDTIKVTDDQLKADFDKLELKRVLIENAGAGSPAVLANEALKAIKGGMSFEDAMNKYSQDRAEKGKARSDAKITKVRRELNGDLRTAIEKLKPGQFTDVVIAPEGAVIYKLISFKPDVPKDYEKTKADLRKSYQQGQVSSVISSELEKLRKSNVVTWKEPAFEAMNRLNQVLTDPKHIPDPKKDAAEFQAILDLCAKATESDETVMKVSALTAYRAFDAIYGLATPAEKKKMADRRIDALTKMLSFVEDTDSHLLLAQLYGEKKDKNNAAENLLTAAHRNVNNLGEMSQSQQIFNRIDDLERKFVAEGLLTPDQQKEIDGTKQEWLEAKKAQEDEQKRAEQERLKAEEEDRKAQQAKPSPSTSPNVTIPGATVPTASPKPSPSPKPPAPGKAK